MIPPGTTTAQAAADGDVITRPVLDALRATTAAPSDDPPARPAAAHTTAVPVAIARPSQASGPVRDTAKAWLAARDHTTADDGQEEALLHAVETSTLTRPPVTAIAQRIDAGLAAIYLDLAQHWIARSRHTGDPRFLNAALKLCAAALLAPVPSTWTATTTVTQALDALARLDAPSAGPPGVPDLLAAGTPPVPPGPAVGNGGVGAARITVLAGAHSRGLPLFLASAAAAGVPIAAVVLHGHGPATTPPDSAYATAWYPQPAASTPQRPATAPAPRPGRTVTHRDWPALATALAEPGTDLLVLIGMDVVPADVLAVPRLGTVNAHNGALPAYRGMDAVAWAMLAADPVVCSAHLATKDVDAGDILTQSIVPASSTDLRQAVKDTQIALLTAICRHTSSTGQLPVGHAQIGPGRRYYRMHPALRRLLDARAAALKEATS